MNALRLILRDRAFWLSAALVAGLQLVFLLLSTPLYDIDTNSYIRGGLSWDIYHNPLPNILIAVCSKIWSSAWLVAGVQVALYGVASAFAVRVLLGTGRWAWAGLAIAALEPLTIYYNFSLLSESLFTSFTLLSVAFLVMWMRHSGGAPAFLAGLMLGLSFAAKLSAMTHLPLFLLFLLRPGRPWQQRIGGLAVAFFPWASVYALVFFGQQQINGGDLYTVEGRVRWDFSSSMYDSSEVRHPAFAQHVHPYLYRDGQYVGHRELRRELSHLGYKDCVAWHERVGHSHNRGVNACDSLFGAVASDIMARHFWAAAQNFVRDNVYFVHHLSYVDYRFTEGLHYYHPASEYVYIDSLMSRHYGVDLGRDADKIPGIWKSLDFGNAYMATMWWLWWLVLGVGAVLLWRRRDSAELLSGLPLLAVPLLFNLVYISYRPRFLAPYLVLLGLMALWELREVWLRRRGMRGG